ncbi:MAG: DUF4845 domain-containing protein [Halofilum sp. (in: g-proteobacteria)]
MRSLRVQRGISPIGWMALLIVVGFVGLVAVRLVPVYLDYYSVVSSAQSVYEKTVRSGGSDREIRESLRRHMQINDINDLGDDIVSIQRGRSGVDLVIDYEVQKPLVGHIDLVLRFNRSIGD